MPPAFLIRLLDCCVEVHDVFNHLANHTDKPQFIKLLKGKDHSKAEEDLCLRLVFCEFLAACTCITLARAEDNIEHNVSPVWHPQT